MRHNESLLTMVDSLRHENNMLRGMASSQPHGHSVSSQSTIPAPSLTPPEGSAYSVASIPPNSRHPPPSLASTSSAETQRRDRSSSSLRGPQTRLYNSTSPAFRPNRTISMQEPMANNTNAVHQGTHVEFTVDQPLKSELGYSPSSRPPGPPTLGPPFLGDADPHAEPSVPPTTVPPTTNTGFVSHDVHRPVLFRPPPLSMAGEKPSEQDTPFNMYQVGFMHENHVF